MRLYHHRHITTPTHSSRESVSQVSGLFKTYLHQNDDTKKLKSAQGLTICGRKSSSGRKTLTVMWTSTLTLTKWTTTQEESDFEPGSEDEE